MLVGLVIMVVLDIVVVAVFAAASSSPGTIRAP
jgi:hypothetical protein